ncbi:MAG TPA: PVC-type heme-binding CxxCH protein [Roseimicrobium sp.]|nr:PVC-type heme-binding CxxCH protein [Roseimicrobium sp.]
MNASGHRHVISTVKILFTLISLLSLLTAANAAPGPIRVLYLGKDGTDSARHCHVVMRELGRYAVWFDYTSDPAIATSAWIQRFDAVLLDAPRESFPALSSVDPKRIITSTFDGDESSWASDAFLKPLAQKLTGAGGEARYKEWEAFFLNGREPEKREANATVANYEKRPQPVTFQYPFSPKGSIERTQVAPDLRLELFATEPEIAKPIFMAWDERGRCWVAETRDYPHDVKPDGQGNDSIKICEDTDGDGRADKFTVFADKLNIPTSFVFANGGIIVSQPPRFLFLKDTDGDGKADVRQEFMTGWGVNDTHAQANNLHYGVDNWLYGCVGYSGFNGSSGGKDLRFAQGTYRFSRDGKTLEFLHQFSNNAWGQSANEVGDQFGGTANNAPIFYGGIPANLAPPGIRIMSAKRINVEDKVHTITPNFRQVDVFGGYTAAAGSAFIYSANLPKRLQGKAMVCEPTMKTISLMDVQPSGAGYVAKDGFNLVASSDEWMSPVFAEVGPDGAVWFADWQNFIIQHNPTPSVDRGGYAAKTGVGGAHENPLRDHVRGRIYRVVWDQAKKPAVTSLAKASDTDLAAALGNDNPFWRLTAQRLLVEGGKTSIVPELKKAVTNAPPIQAIHALWTLQGLGQLDEATHRTALLHKDSTVRRNATRALGDDAAAQKLFFSAGVISDPDPVTKLAAIVKLASFPTTPGIVPVVTSLAKNPALRSDEWLADAVRLATKRHKVDAYKEGPNLLPNPGFEVIGANGLPEGWTRRDYGNRPANEGAEWKVVAEGGQYRGGKQAVRCITRGDADTSLYADVALKPNTQYRLSAWIKTHALRGKASLNDHINRHETTQIKQRESDWSEVEVVFNSGKAAKSSINLLHVASGDSYFDDVKLCEVLPIDDTEGKPVIGDAKRGQEIFLHHAAACVLCHSLKGEGSTVGPPLDGIATRQNAAYIKQSLLEPSAILAKGYEQLGVSPMPPMGDIFNSQELADIQAFVLTLK